MMEDDDKKVLTAEELLAEIESSAMWVIANAEDLNNMGEYTPVTEEEFWNSVESITDIDTYEEGFQDALSAVKAKTTIPSWMLI